MDLDLMCDSLPDDLDRRICAELRAEFLASCSKPVEPDAVPLLMSMLVEGLIEPRRQAKLPWEGYTQKFFLFTATSLGKKLERAATNDGGVVTLAMVKVAVHQLADCWERFCPLTGPDGEDLRGGCETLRMVEGLRR